MAVSLRKPSLPKQAVAGLLKSCSRHTAGSPRWLHAAFAGTRTGTRLDSDSRPGGGRLSLGPGPVSQPPALGLPLPQGQCLSLPVSPSAQTLTGVAGENGVTAPAVSSLAPEPGAARGLSPHSMGGGDPGAAGPELVRKASARPSGHNTERQLPEEQLQGPRRPVPAAAPQGQPGALRL